MSRFDGESADWELLYAMDGGEEERSEAFTVLVNRHAQVFYRVAYRIVLNKEEAEDIVQEAFLKLIDGRAKWKREIGTEFKSWFYRVLVNQALTHKRKKVGIEYEDSFSSTDPEVGPERLLEKRQEQLQIFNALKLLSYKQRVAVELFYYSGLSQKEAANAMGINIKAYESLVSRGKDQIKQELKDYDG